MKQVKIKRNIFLFFTVVTMGGMTAAAALAQTKVYPCSGANAYGQPNSSYAERVTTFGDQTAVDLVSRSTDTNGIKWIQVKWFNGFPGQSGAGWLFGWVRSKDICK